MTRPVIVALIAAFTILVIALMAWGWWRRMKRDAGLSAPPGELPPDAEQIAEHEVLYVATTAHDEPLERLAIRGLAFRSKATVVITRAGVALDLTGQSRRVLTPDRIDLADQATVAIDRVVEKDGLVRVVWRTPEDVVVDTYLRAQDASARAVVDEIRTILPPWPGTAAGEAPTPTGSDA